MTTTEPTIEQAVAELEATLRGVQQEIKQCPCLGEQDSCVGWRLHKGKGFSTALDHRTAEGREWFAEQLTLGVVPQKSANPRDPDKIRWVAIARYWGEPPKEWPAHSADTRSEAISLAIEEAARQRQEQTDGPE